MRLKIKEYVESYNERNGTKTKMQDLADIVYADKAWTKQSRKNRISSLNTGSGQAYVWELARIVDFLEIDCCEIIEI